MTDSSFWGSGWSFPPTFDKGNLKLQVTTNTDNINQSIDLILSTTQGDQPLNQSFGATVSTFLIKNMDATTQGQLINAIESALTNDEPRITVNSVDLQMIDDYEPVVEITIDYTVRKTNSRHNHVYPFSLNEGTSLVQTGN